MRFFPLLAVLAIVGTCLFGCNLITGIGSLSFSDAQSDGGPGGSGSGGSSGGSSGSSGGVVPSGSRVVTSSTLQLRGMTTDGFVAYGDTSSGALSVLDVEQADGGPPASSAPVALGAADISTAYVAGALVLFFSPGGEADAGASRVGALNAWSSTLGVVTSIGTDVLEPLTYFTFAASADGEHLAYLGNVAADGATASLFLVDVATAQKQELVASVDVLGDLCQPRLTFSGEYLAASYCQVASGGGIAAGTSRFIATVSTFAVPGGQQATLATNVDARFGIDPNGVAAIMLGAGGLVASAVSGAGGLVAVDPAGASGAISSDGRTVVYATTADALKRASTSAPPNPSQLAPSSFAAVDALSSDGAWVIGALTAGSQDDTSDLYVASATLPGGVVTLSSATTASVDLAGDSFTADSKYAVFLTGVTSDLTGTLTTYQLGQGGAPSSLGAGAYEDVALTGSQLVFNVNDASGKADLEWANLAWGSTPTVIALQADETFFVGPANDKVAFTYSNGGSSDGLWIAPVPGSPGTVVTCATAGSFHPPSGSSASCTSDDVSFYDTDCVSSSTASSDLCSGIESVIGTPCFECLDTQLASSQWGVLVENPAGGGILQINAGGCFSSQGDAACAQASQSLLECENTACASQTTIDGYDACQTTADTATCACNVANVTAACAALTTSPCSPASYTTFEAKFLAYAQVMCE